MNYLSDTGLQEGEMFAQKILQGAYADPKVGAQNPIKDHPDRHHIAEHIIDKITRKKGNQAWGILPQWVKDTLFEDIKSLTRNFYNVSYARLPQATVAQLKTKDPTFVKAYIEALTYMETFNQGKPEDNVELAGYEVFNPQRPNTTFKNIEQVIGHGEILQLLAGYFPSVTGDLKKVQDMVCERVKQASKHRLAKRDAGNTESDVIRDQIAFDKSLKHLNEYIARIRAINQMRAAQTRGQSLPRTH